MTLTGTMKVIGPQTVCMFRPRKDNILMFICLMKSNDKHQCITRKDYSTTTNNENKNNKSTFTSINYLINLPDIL